MKTSLASSAAVSLFILASAGASAAETGPLPGVHSEELMNVVVVSRHGVRSPTQSAEKLESWSSKKWPNFGVDPGILTKRGYYLVERTWALNRTRAPFTYGTCPKPDDVQIIADTDERTIATAKALNEGLYPGCGYQVRTTDKKHSALFSPLKAKVCKIEYPKELAEKLTERAAGFSKIYGSEIAEVEKILGRELTGKMRGKASKHKVGYEGAPYSAASITEIFALEWGQFPGQKAGWGVLDWPGIMQLMPLRVGVFTALNRDMEVAAYKGSALAKKIIDSLDHGPKYTYLVGHDTNLANLGALFDLNWKLPNRAKNENTPGGYLTFEKWLVNGDAEIRVYYSALTPEQMNAETVTEPTADFEILPRGVKFDEWKKASSRFLFSKCIEDGAL